MNKIYQLLPQILTAIIIILIVGFSYIYKHNIDKNIHHVTSVVAMKEIKYEVTTSHLWLEEVVSGDTTENKDKIWDQLRQAKWYANAMLFGGESTGVIFVPLSDPAQRLHIADTLNLLNQFEAISKARLENSATSKFGSNINQAYDKLYEQLIHNINIVEKNNLSMIIEDNRQIENIQFVIISFLIIIFIALHIIFKAGRKREKLLRQNNEKSKETIVTIMDSIMDGIISINKTGTIETVNPAAVRLFGYTASEMIGENVKMLMPEPYKSKHDGYLNNNNTIGNNTIINVGRELVGQRKDGSTFPMELTVSKMQANNENMFTGILRDISERKKLDSVKNEFISTISHELRTPLTSISGSLGLVMAKSSGLLPDKTRHLLEIAERNSERLTLLINDILDLEKIESGDLSFDFKSIDLVNLATRAIEDSMGYANKYQVNLILTPQTTTVQVRVDPNRLLQVFSNLISNAIKFSPQNGTVEVSVIANGDSARVEVRDYGDGIPEEFRSQLYERFSQADSSDTRKVAGTGLGLSITKAILEHHGGNIDYDSQTGVGTVFYFNLPRIDVIEHPRANSMEDQTVPRNRNHALICEDNPDITQILCTMLDDACLTYDCAENATMARELIAKNDYSMLLLDLTLPDIDGITFLTELNEDTATATLPVIVISGRANEAHASLSLDKHTGSVVDWIQKPIDKSRLEYAFKVALQSKVFPSILHVEDDEDIQKITKIWLDGIVEITHARNLNEARKKLAAHKFDLVILDIGLPDGSGVELLDEVQGRCPVLIFSAQFPSYEIRSRVAKTLTKSSSSSDHLPSTIKEILHITSKAA